MSSIPPSIAPQEKEKPSLLSLPIELRFKIYGLCDPPRILEFDNVVDRHSIFGPTIHQLSSEAREETMKGYELVTGHELVLNDVQEPVAGKHFTYMVNFERDVFFPNVWGDYPYIELYLLAETPHMFPSPEKIQRLAIGTKSVTSDEVALDPLIYWREWQTKPEGVELWRTALRKFPSLRELIIVLDPGLKLETRELLDTWPGLNSGADLILMDAIMQEFERNKLKP